jgi:hypothetical protein
MNIKYKQAQKTLNQNMAKKVENIKTNLLMDFESAEILAYKLCEEINKYKITPLTLKTTTVSAEERNILIAINYATNVTFDGTGTTSFGYLMAIIQYGIVNTDVVLDYVRSNFKLVDRQQG